MLSLSRQMIPGLASTRQQEGMYTSQPPPFSIDVRLSPSWVETDLNAVWTGQNTQLGVACFWLARPSTTIVSWRAQKVLGPTHLSHWSIKARLDSLSRLDPIQQRRL
jgi:hypothetical protein